MKIKFLIKNTKRSYLSMYHRGDGCFDDEVYCSFSIGAIAFSLKTQRNNYEMTEKAYRSTIIAS